jgi:effector-binding domain-containing protein
MKGLQELIEQIEQKKWNTYGKMPDFFNGMDAALELVKQFAAEHEVIVEKYPKGKTLYVILRGKVEPVEVSEYWTRMFCINSSNGWRIERQNWEIYETAEAAQAVVDEQKARRYK